MKKLYLLVCILATGFLFSSCKKEDKKSPESSIMGIWKGEKNLGTYYRNGIVLDSDTIYMKLPNYIIIEFKKENQLLYKEFSDNELDTENLYYKVVGDKLIIMEDVNDPDPEEYTIKINGNKLILWDTYSYKDTDGVTWKIDSEMHFIR